MNTTKKAALQSQLSGIATRFLERTAQDIGSLRQLIEGARQGETDSLQRIHAFGHRIAGSGGLFGFGAISEAGRQIALLAKDADAAHTAAGCGLCERLDELADRLEHEVRAVRRPDSVA